MSGELPRLRTTENLTPDQVASVLTLVRDATRADGMPPMREQALLQLQSGSPGLCLLAEDPDPARRSLLGLAHVDSTDAATGPEIEVVVHPGARQQGIGTALLDEVLALCPAPPSPVWLWAHGENAVATQLARARGFGRERQLLQMRRSLDSPLPEVHLPTGMGLRRFDPDRDVPALRALNAASFTELPDQGGWTERDIRARMAEDWFDPAGLLLATSGADLVGFHWTKTPVRDRTVEPAQDSEGLGEVYVLGVHPRARGQGLGRALTLAGLHHLRDQGLAGSLLYVDTTNAPAIALYTSLEFSVWDSDMLFRR